ncbi:MAG: CHASE2 domain-containing protein [Chloroflexi bacterium]|nr:CHASE2 domain-containing protein [Chloroflexota bacterium]
MEKAPVSLRTVLLLGTAVILLLIQIAGFFPGITTPLESLEYSLCDLFMRLRGVEKPSGDIVIVAIDDFSFNWTGYQWPWAPFVFRGDRGANQRGWREGRGRGHHPRGAG